jgi:hypothetical protein
MNQGNVNAFLEIRKKGKEQEDNKEEEKEVFRGSKKTARLLEVEKKTDREKILKKLEEMKVEIKEEIKEMRKKNQEVKREIK